LKNPIASSDLGLSRIEEHAGIGRGAPPLAVVCRQPRLDQLLNPVARDTFWPVRRPGVREHSQIAARHPGWFGRSIA
jgi:hypothetical protein